LDEIEKAHPDVMELFYQAFDKGFMEDAEGREVDFKNTVILLTSNVGTDLIMQSCGNVADRPEPSTLAEALGPQLNRVFKPAFLGRLIVIPYYPIDDDSLRKIIRLKLERIAKRMQETHHVPFTYSEELVSEIVDRCTEVESGARNVDHILTGTLLPKISAEVLSRMMSGNILTHVHVAADSTGFQYDIA
jgi:type VI secretion system protein VasG